MSARKTRNRVAGSGVALILSLSAQTAMLPVAAQAVHKPPKLVTGKDGRPYIANQLIVMTAPSANNDEISQLLKEVHGTVLHRAKVGANTMLMLEFPEDSFDKAEQKLSKDKHFSAVQRNYASGVHVQ